MGNPPSIDVVQAMVLLLNGYQNKQYRVNCPDWECVSWLHLYRAEGHYIWNRSTLSKYFTHIRNVVVPPRSQITIVIPFLPGENITTPTVLNGKIFTLRVITSHYP